ncbi:hypothetical protein [Maricaulis salignorans]|uniref:Uncharacterized protein n=1 Tax=Maricaulis salignorans TaxID=144026 RepID=A0A1G9T744_9PROT|nr:hypothetical protein [Maricaulis salignorans]SDM43430.1 hypothetical protein SAMN04488568_11154 [Maricaulis salignorans]
MIDLFQSYWWLLFPLFWFVGAGWGSLMRFKRTQAKIDLIKTYAAAGKEAPAELIASLDAPDTSDDDDTGYDGERHSGGGRAFLVVLFGGLAGVFAFTGYTGWIGGVDTELYFVAMILGVLSFAFLVSAMFKSGRKGG